MSDYWQINKIKVCCDSRLNSRPCWHIFVILGVVWAFPKGSSCVHGKKEIPHVNEISCKWEISGVNCKGVRNRSLARNSMSNEHLEWETSNIWGEWKDSIFLAGSRSQDLLEEVGPQLSRRVVNLLWQNPPLQESRGIGHISNSICRLFDSSIPAFLPSTRMAIIVLNSLCLASKPGFISRLSVW